MQEFGADWYAIEINGEEVFRCGSLLALWRESKKYDLAEVDLVAYENTDFGVRRYVGMLIRKFERTIFAIA